MYLSELNRALAIRQTLILFKAHLEQEQLTLWTGSTKSQETLLLGTSSSKFAAVI